MLILINGTNIVQPTARLWAHAHFGKRFVRQGASRIEASSSSASLNVTAFANTDGTTAVQVINNSNSTESVTLELPLSHHQVVQTYLTNQEYDLQEGYAKVEGVRGRKGHWGGKRGWAGKHEKTSAVAHVPGQSLLSFYICG